VYKLKLVYNTQPRTQTLKESVTYCVCLELYTQLSIEAYQTSATVLEFLQERDRTIAALYLSGSTSFTTVCVD
jgi:hypothetical protein